VRTHGTVLTWDAGRGFGFIAPAQGEERLFVHVSAFPRGGVAPQVGELVSFEVEVAPDGRKRAVRVMRTEAMRSARPPRTAPAADRPPRAPYRPPRVRRTVLDTLRERLTMMAITVVVLLAGSGLWKLAASPAPQPVPSAQVAPRPAPAPLAAPRPAPPPVAPVVPAPAAPPLLVPEYACDGRTRCQQMHSCEESRYFLRNCPTVQMDGDGDGEPCERQWCG
jgi:cold shock CspA family protein